MLVDCFLQQFRQKRLAFKKSLPFLENYLMNQMDAIATWIYVMVLVHDNHNGSLSQQCLVDLHFFLL